VVISDATSLPEIAGQAGVQVGQEDVEQAAQALLQVIPGGEERERCIALGLARARHFTWAQCARQTLGVYREALG
jgi:alpha-1,3-rhamnosyl/mannosyltransferase